MSTLACFTQFEHGTAGHHFLTVTDKRRNDVFQVHQLRLTIIQTDHVDAERVLQLRMQEQVIHHHFCIFATLQVDRDTHAFFIRLITQFGNTFKFLFFD